MNCRLRRRQGDGAGHDDRGRKRGRSDLQADVIVLLVAADNDSMKERCHSFWLPLFRKLVPDVDLSRFH